MSIDPLVFLDEPSVEESAVVKRPGGEQFRSGFESFLKTRAPKGRDIRADVITSGTGIAGLPGDLASIFIGENPLTSKSLREKGFELFPSLAPENEKEKEWDEGLSLVMGLASPTAPIKAVGKLAGQGLSKLGIKSPSFLKGKYKELYDLGKQMGIDEKALAPFKHGKVTEASIKQLAKLGEEAKQGVKFAEQLAVPLYDDLYNAGSKIPLNQITRRGVTKGLENIIHDIKKSPALVKESKDVVNFLEEAIHGIKSNPDATVENLMALQKQLGKTVNWTSIRQSGKGHLVQEARSAVEKGIYGMNPSLGKKFTDMDKLYAGYKKLSKEVGPAKLWEYASKGGPVGAFLLSLLMGHDVLGSLETAGGVHYGKKALGKISGKLLTDPKWVGLKEKIFGMIKKGSTENLPKMIQAIKKKAQMEHINLEEREETEDPLAFLD